jgi:predicted oxidoreductase
MAPSGPEVSRLAYGVWRLLDDPEGSSVQRTLGKIGACLDVGITTFDHADIYGGYGCEEAFGQALAVEPALREKMELVTKCGIMLTTPARPDNRVKHYDHSAGHIETSVERSLRNLRTDRIDVLLLHRPSPMLDADETAGALERLCQAGKILHVGVSNFTPWQFNLLASRFSRGLVTNQVEVHPLRAEPFLDGTLDQCQQLRISPMAWSPTAGGRIFGEGVREKRVHDALVMVAQRMQVSMDQALYAWLLKHPSNIIPVLGTHRIDRITSAAQALGKTMDLQDWFTIWSATIEGEVP